jgi:hypothetical protein
MFNETGVLSLIRRVLFGPNRGTHIDDSAANRNGMGRESGADLDRRLDRIILLPPGLKSGFGRSTICRTVSLVEQCANNQSQGDDGKEPNC